MRARAAAWAQRYTLEGLREALGELLEERWRGLERIGVLHLVDTLEPGGAERVAVELANHLPRERFRPFLGTTRREGALADRSGRTSGGSP